MAKNWSVTIEETDDGYWLRYHFNDGATPPIVRIVRLSFDDMVALAAGLETNLNSDA